MKIVILDGYAANPGDLSWEEIAGEGELTVYDRTAPEDALKRMEGAEVVYTNKVVITRQMMEACPELKLISVTATGYNVVDTDAARDLGILVCNVPAYSTRDVAQMTFALLLELCHSVGQHSRGVFEGKWTSCKDFCYWEKTPMALYGKTMGLVGFGQIGQAVAKLALAFGMEVLVYTRTPRKELEEEKLHFCDLDTLLRRAHVISLHCPLTEASRGMINRASMEKMRPGALLVNTGRGPLLDEAEVAQALREGKLGGLAVDVVSVEPIRADNPLLTAPNCIITPHIAWATKEARERLLSVSAENLRQYKKGTPQNVVNP